MLMKDDLPSFVLLKKSEKSDAEAALERMMMWLAPFWRSEPLGVRPGSQIFHVWRSEAFGVRPRLKF